jgi:hypothetical protein
MNAGRFLNQISHYQPRGQRSIGISVEEMGGKYESIIGHLA